MSQAASADTAFTAYSLADIALFSPLIDAARRALKDIRQLKDSNITSDPDIVATTMASLLRDFVSSNQQLPSSMRFPEHNRPECEVALAISQEFIFRDADPGAWNNVAAAFHWFMTLTDREHTVEEMESLRDQGSSLDTESVQSAWDIYWGRRVANTTRGVGIV